MGRWRIPRFPVTDHRPPIPPRASAARPLCRRGAPGQEGDCLAATLRSGNVHSADGWEEVLLPVIDRYQAQKQTVVVRADAAFALPALNEALERRDARRTERGSRFMIGSAPSRSRAPRAWQR